MTKEELEKIRGNIGMSVNELNEAWQAGTWLTYAPLYTLPQPPRRLVKITGPGRSFDSWVVHDKNADSRAIVALFCELRPATPQDFINLGEP